MVEPRPPGRIPALMEAGGGYPQFLFRWHGLWRRRAGVDGLRRTVSQLQGIELPASELEHRMLRARVADYSSLQLDELIGGGEVVWQGGQPAGAHDGTLRLFLGGDFPLLGRISVFAPGDRERQIRDALLDGDGLEFEQLMERLGGFPEDILKTLWKLVWSGEATSDSLNALRARRSSTAGRYQRRPRPRYTTRKRIPPGAAGRWRLVAGPRRGFAPEAERRLGLAAQLLHRYGIACRGTMAGEAASFESLLPCFEQLEAQGRVRRVQMLEWDDGIQFIAPGAEDVWRAAAEEPPSGTLSACDPANPFGTMMPWPAMMDDHLPRRVPGASVLVDAGKLIAYVTRTGRRVYTTRNVAEPGPWIRLLKQSTGGEPLFLELINGEPPYKTRWHRELTAAGFSPSRRGYLLRTGA